MPQRSRYDELHDKYNAILTTKAGTRYERLAALVFKILDQSGVVIHDLKLVGDSTVSHQIDVSIEVGGNARRVVIECKDFDISGNSVGLDILRSFRSVIEDTEADEGIVITCNGYTSDAQKYAKAKGIKLAILRQAQAADLEGLIQKIIIQMHVQSHHNHATTVHMDQADRDKFYAELERVGIAGGINSLQPVYVVRGEEKIQFTEFLSKEVNTGPATKGEDGRWQVKTPAKDWKLQVDNGPLVSFSGFVTTYDIVTDTFPMEIASNRVAELIVSGLGADDVIIFDDQIRRLKIDEETGEILEPGAAVPKV